jgi:DNA invertase Pin-like site-specific DNA recombinase
MRVALYARYSSDQQRDASIEDQLHVCRARAEREGWTVVSTFADHAISGATNQRPEFQRLTKDLQAGLFDMAMAEAIDRFSRDLEHIAAFYKLCVFHQVRIHTVADGDVSEIHIGLKGMMGSLFLRDLADKTRRGLEGRVRAGRSTGAPAYGFEVVRKLTDAGELDRGLRAIDPVKARTIVRIFEAYAGGASPRRIASDLNAERIVGPGGGVWYNASILGGAKRGDGLLRNELYVGRLVWRRRVNAKDPVNGTQVRRNGRAEDIIVKDVPHLRIIDDPLWQRVQDRLKAEAAPIKPTAGGDRRAFWDRRRPRHLLSGKVVCGICGRQVSAFGKDYLGCKAAAHGTCRNTKRVRRTKLEAQVLDALVRELMEPGLVTEFIAAFNAEWRRLAAEVRATEQIRLRERTAIDRKIANLIEAISDGRSSKAILAKLEVLEGQKANCETHSGPLAPMATALHPGIAQVYSAKVCSLRSGLAEGRDPETLEAARALIDQVIINPPETDGDPPRIEVVGELMAMLQAAGVGRGRTDAGSTAPDPVLSLFVSSVKHGPGAAP